MPIETYEQAVAFWNSRINYEKIGMPQDMGLLKLDRMRLMLKLLDQPQEKYRLVHVTGTKGKGSTATMMASMLRAAGHRVGLYTSPHLVHVEERIQIDGEPISREAMTRCMRRVAEACEEVEHHGEAAPTFFEIITAVGLLYFAESQVDFAVLEVGMGGRFDATNVVTPLVSVITSVSLDHLEQLGPTVEHIAAEKAGIIKEGVPVVSGVTQPGPASVIAEVAKKQQARLFQLGVDFQVEWKPGNVALRQLPQLRLNQGDWLTLPLWGHHQANNAALAIQAARLLQLHDVAIRQGLERTFIPGRLEILGRSPWLILDAAHNAESIERLLDWLKDLPASKRYVVFAVSKDKQIREMLQLLRDDCDEVCFTRYASSTRGADPQHLLSIWQSIGGALGSVIEPADAAWLHMVKQANRDDVIVATGSVFLVGEIRKKYFPC